MKKQNSSVGHMWSEVCPTLFTEEEIRESDLRVALIGEWIKARQESGKPRAIKSFKKKELRR